MAKSSTARKLDDAPMVPSEAATCVRRRWAAGAAGSAQYTDRQQRLARQSVMFLGAEAMFFAGLIGAFLVFRIGSPVWPPPFQPRLPAGVTGNQYADSARQRGDDAAWRFRANQRGDRARLMRLLLWTARSWAATFFIDSGISNGFA